MKFFLSFLSFCVVSFSSCTNSTKHTHFSPYQAKDSFLYLESEASFYVCEEGLCSKKNSSKLLGSGFIVGVKENDSIGITAAHLCEPETPYGTSHVVQSIKVNLWEGESYEAQIINVLSSVDICVLKIPGVALKPLRVAAKAPVYGDKAYVLSAPLGIWGPKMVLAFDGYYSGRSNKPVFEFTSLDAYTIPTRGGSSGSPILNEKGEVIGMTVISMGRLQAFCMSPPHSAIKAAITAALKD